MKTSQQFACVELLSHRAGNRRMPHIEPRKYDEGFSLSEHVQEDCLWSGSQLPGCLKSEHHRWDRRFSILERRVDGEECKVSFVESESFLDSDSGLLEDVILERLSYGVAFSRDDAKIVIAM